MHDDKVVERIKLFTSDEIHPKVTQLSHRLLSDANFRASFLNDPNAALKQAGIPSDVAVKLSDRDKLMLKMVGDTHIADLYKTGNVANLRQYLNANYGGLKLPSDSRVQDAAADFDVLIEAEAVAVAVVAVAAVAIGTVAVQFGEQFTIIAEQNSVINARVAALEARVRLLEK